MEMSAIKPDVIKYEVRALSGVPIGQAQTKKTGGFARFLSGIGRLFGAIAAPLSLVFPPAALGAAGAYSMSRIGDMMQVGAARKQMASQASAAGQDLGQVYIPGLTQASMDLTTERAGAQSVTAPRDQQVNQILTARNDLMLSTTKV